MSALQLQATAEANILVEKTTHTNIRQATRDGFELEPAHAVPDAEQRFVDTGLPLPEIYDLDIIRAMVQDPFRIFVYWDIREQSLETLKKYFSTEDAATFQTTLKLMDVDSGAETLFEVKSKSSYWLMVLPGRTYELDIGVRSPQHGYISLMRSNRVRTPSGTISHSTTDETEYRNSAPEFHRVLAASGFADHAINLTRAPATAAKVERPRESAKLLEPPPSGILSGRSGKARVG
ncbi:MAG: DUF4912 domain-containing protein [Blastocatellia bacterium]